jgi:hypothetical protein
MMAARPAESLAVLREVTTALQRPAMRIAAWPSKTIGGLTDRQRAELAARLNQ